MTTTSYTSGLRLTNQPTGGNASTWGAIADDNFEFLDNALTAEVTIDMTGSTSYTLTVANGAEDEARNATLKIVGVPTSANSVIIPSNQKQYIIKAVHTSVSGGITVRTGGGTGVSFNTSETGLVYCDGTSVVRIGSRALLPENNLSDLVSVDAAVSNLGLNAAASFTSIAPSLAVTSGALGVVLTAVADFIYPVGSVYSNRTDGTNPGTLFGVGTWVSAGTGRVLIGNGTGVDTNGVSVVISAQTCGGLYQEIITSAKMPLHKHETGSWSNSGTTAVFAHHFPSGSWPYGSTGRSRSFRRDGGESPFGGTTGDTLWSGPPEEVSAPTSNLDIVQPYYSVYMWVRTA